MTRRVSLKRGKLRKRSKRKARQDREQSKSKAILMKRHDGVCAYQIPGVCRWFATDFSHTKNRSQGGGYGTKDGKLGCWACHRYIGLHPAEAYEKGWLVKSWQQVPEDAIEAA